MTQDTNNKPQEFGKPMTDRELFAVVFGYGEICYNPNAIEFNERDDCDPKSHAHYQLRKSLEYATKALGGGIVASIPHYGEIGGRVSVVGGGICHNLAEEAIQAIIEDWRKQFPQYCHHPLPIDDSEPTRGE